jgi:hypothetical protein
LWTKYEVGGEATTFRVFYLHFGLKTQIFKELFEIFEQGSIGDVASRKNSML